MDKKSEEKSGWREKKAFLAKCVGVPHYQSLGFFLVLLSWFLCILARESQQWQIWQVENIPGIREVKIGLWKVCIPHHTPGGQYVKTHCEEFSKLDISIPSGILMAQILMTLSVVLQTAALGLISYCLWISPSKKQQTGVIIYLSNIGILLSFISAITTLIPITWDASSTLAKEGIPFPNNLHLPSNPQKWHVGNAMYMGLISATLQVIGGLIIACDKSQRFNKICPLFSVVVDPAPSRRDCQSSPPLWSFPNTSDFSVASADGRDSSATSSEYGSAICPSSFLSHQQFQVTALIHPPPAHPPIPSPPASPSSVSPSSVRYQLV